MKNLPKSIDLCKDQIILETIFSFHAIATSGVKDTIRHNLSFRDTTAKKGFLNQTLCKPDHNLYAFHLCSRQDSIYKKVETFQETFFYSLNVLYLFVHHWEVAQGPPAFSNNLQ